MGVLESVLNYKARKEAEQAQAANAIPQAVAAFIQGRQQQVENQQKNLLLQIQAGQAGYQIDPSGQLVVDTNSPAYQMKSLDADYKRSAIKKMDAQVAATEQKSQTVGNYDAKTPEEFMASLDPSKQQLISQVVAGQVDPYKVSSLRTGERERLLGAASKYAELRGEDFDPAAYQTRFNTRKEFSTGKWSQVINAGNTALGHMDTLKEKLGELKNTGVPVWNAVKNRYEKETGGTGLSSVRPAIEAVSAELMRFYRNAGVGSEKEITDWKNSFDENASPKQQQAYLDTGIDLLASKIGSIRETWKQGMGTYKGLNIFTPEAKEALKNLGKEELIQKYGSEEGNQVSAETKVIKGMTYEKRGDGKWYPKK